MSGSGTSLTSLLYHIYSTGAPIGMLYHKASYADGVFNRYLFERDVFGNVISVYNIETGAKVGSYCYDAWGNCTVLTNTDGIGALNPFRYRGYYLDIETNLYYLQTRYYDSYVGRFINGDSVLLGSDGHFSGYNMFVYCYNDPVCMVDSAGCAPSMIYISIPEKYIDETAKYIEEIVEDCKNFDINNTSEEKVLRSHHFSYYKGVLVLRINGDRSASFGIIFLTRDTNYRSDPEDYIRHEYGHIFQLQELGVIKYTLCIAIPSIFEWGEKIL